MIEQQDLDIYDLMLANEHGDEESDSDSEDISGSAPTPSPLVPGSAFHLESEDGGVGSDSSFGRREKARRKTTTKEDLLFNDADVPEIRGPPSFPTTPVHLPIPAHTNLK